MADEIGRCVLWSRKGCGSEEADSEIRNEALEFRGVCDFWRSQFLSFTSDRKWQRTQRVESVWWERVADHDGPAPGGALRSLGVQQVRLFAFFCLKIPFTLMLNTNRFFCGRFLKVKPKFDWDWPRRAYMVYNSVNHSTLKNCAWFWVVYSRRFANCFPCAVISAWQIRLAALVKRSQNIKPWD